MPRQHTRSSLFLLQNGPCRTRNIPLAVPWRTLYSRLEAFRTHQHHQGYHTHCHAFRPYDKTPKIPSLLRIRRHRPHLRKNHSFQCCTGPSRAVHAYHNIRQICSGRNKQLKPLPHNLTIFQADKSDFTMLVKSLAYFAIAKAVMGKSKLCLKNYVFGAYLKQMLNATI